MKRKGFVYTLYALIVLNLIFLLMFAPLEYSSGLEKVSGVSEMNSFVQSIFHDMNRGIDAAAGRSMVTVSSMVIDDGEPIDSAQEVFPEVFMNGTLDGEPMSIMEETSFSDWMISMEEQAEHENYFFEMEVRDVKLSSEGFETFFEVIYDLHVNESSVSAGFDFKERSETVEVSAEGFEDPLMRLETGGTVSNFIERCEPERKGAEKVLEGVIYHYNTSARDLDGEWFSGEPFVYGSKPLEDVEDPETKTLLIEDLCDAESEKVSDFGGVVSETENDIEGFCGSEENLEVYVGGVPSIEDLEFSAPIVLMEEKNIWESYITEMVDEQCFFYSSEAPDFFDRMEDVEGEQGFASLIDVPSLPSEFRSLERSAVDHLYFDDSGEEVRKLKGISDVERYSWFRIDEKSAETLDVEDLLY